MTVLIVDTSPLVTSRLVELLEDVKCITAVKISNSYEDAILQINSFKPNVILLEINLPGSNGIELLKYTRALCPATYIIMVSNQSGEYYRSLCERLGANGFIDKSKDFDSIPYLLSSFN